MGIAIGAAAVGSVLDFWLVLRNPTYLDGLEPQFAIVNLSLVALNVLFLVGMWRQAKLAWGAAVAVVVLGAISDAGGVFLSPYLEFGNFGGVLNLVASVAPSGNWLEVGLLSSWVHLVVIQVPILALLIAPSSRRWFDVAMPASIANAETPR
jgi:hypothetical protein